MNFFLENYSGFLRKNRICVYRLGLIKRTQSNHLHFSPVNSAKENRGEF
ncbi:hypothetical protein LEP1GSC198_1694 [Leptospira kirschneri str. JB]|nr:hypothetical protein LEP1GSC198_1694 [Leptospira kirschneri str. JB]